MLLKDYSFETMLPECNPMAETINAIAHLSDDIGEVLPYLAAVIKVCEGRIPSAEEIKKWIEEKK